MVITPKASTSNCTVSLYDSASSLLITDSNASYSGVTRDNLSLSIEREITSMAAHEPNLFCYTEDGGFRARAELYRGNRSVPYDDDKFTPTKHLTPPPHHSSSRPAAAHTETETPLLHQRKG